MLAECCFNNEVSFQIPLPGYSILTFLAIPILELEANALISDSIIFKVGLYVKFFPLLRTITLATLSSNALITWNSASTPSPSSMKTIGLEYFPFLLDTVTPEIFLLALSHPALTTASNCVGTVAPIKVGNFLYPNPKLETPTECASPTALIDDVT